MDFNAPAEGRGDMLTSDDFGEIFPGKKMGRIHQHGENESDDVWQIFKCDRRSQHFNAFHLCEDVFGENSEDLAEEIEDEMPPS